MALGPPAGFRLSASGRRPAHYMASGTAGPRLTQWQGPRPRLQKLPAASSRMPVGPMGLLQWAARVALQAARVAHLRDPAGAAPGELARIDPQFGSS
jgi:hypothetical protein